MAVLIPLVGIIVIPIPIDLLDPEAPTWSRRNAFCYHRRGNRASHAGSDHHGAQHKTYHSVLEHLSNLKNARRRSAYIDLIVPSRVH